MNGAENDEFALRRSTASQCQTGFTVGHLYGIRDSEFAACIVRKLVWDAFVRESGPFVAGQRRVQK